MRKDYIQAEASAPADDIAFIEAYWTRLWDAQGGPTAAVDAIRSDDAFADWAAELAKLPRGATVVDGGCGLGAWAVHARREGHEVIALDISRTTIAKLNEMFPDVDFRVTDIRATEIPADSVDLYFSWGVFEHFEEGLGPCIDEAFRILKPGGRLIITVPLDNWRHALVGQRFGGRAASPRGASTGEAPYRFYQWRLTRAEIATELAIRGFTVDRVRAIGKTQGLHRVLQQNFGIGPEGRGPALLVRGLRALVPTHAVGHMQLVLARKPG